MIIGSTAIKHWFPDFQREPNDLDIVVANKEYRGPTKTKDGKRIEYLENPVLMSLAEREYADPNILYTLKCSHSFWALKNKSWAKHMYDLQFLQEKGAKLITPLVWKLYDYWLSLHGEHKKSNLDMSAEEFFTNALTTGFDHDTAHTWLIQHPYFKGQEEPTYKLILKDGAEVDVCMDKFDALTEEQKFNVTFEEVALMAYERMPNMNYRRAFNLMLGKFIREHCYPRQGLWIIQNTKKLIKDLPFNYNEFLTDKIKENEK